MIHVDKVTVQIIKYQNQKTEFVLAIQTWRYPGKLLRAETYATLFEPYLVDYTQRLQSLYFVLKENTHYKWVRAPILPFDNKGNIPEDFHDTTRVYQKRSQD